MDLLLEVCPITHTPCSHQSVHTTGITGETIPIRLFLGGFDLTPTFREVNKKYSTRYYLSLVLIDEGSFSNLPDPCFPFSLPFARDVISWRGVIEIPDVGNSSRALINDMRYRCETLFQAIRNIALSSSSLKLELLITAAPITNRDSVLFYSITIILIWILLLISFCLTFDFWCLFFFLVTSLSTCIKCK